MESFEVGCIVGFLTGFTFTLMIILIPSTSDNNDDPRSGGRRPE